MFREMRRKKQELSREDCIRVLCSEKRGVLSVLGDDGYPYGIPMNYIYDPEQDRIYFHSSKVGHKIDAITACDKVSFCVHDQGYRRPGEWAWNVQSVILFGRLRPVTDYEKAMQHISAMASRYTEDRAYIEREIRTAGPVVLCLELIPEHMTGKLVNES